MKKTVFQVALCTTLMIVTSFCLDGNVRASSLLGGGGGSGVTDHGALTGLSDDDHTQYALSDGSRALSGLTATTVPYLDASKVLKSSAVTPTELGYVSGVSSAIQTQLNAKAGTGASFIPSSDNTYDLGSSSFRWGAGYFGTGWTSNSTTVTGNTAGTSYVRQFTNGTIDFKHASNAARHLLYAESNGLFYYGDAGANKLVLDPATSGDRITLLGTQANIVCGATGCNLGDASQGFTLYAKGPIITVPSTVDVTADNQAVVVNTKSHIRFTSDNSTATSRTITLGDGLSDGQHLLLEWNEDVSTGAGELADTSGQVDLVGGVTWSPNIGDTLELSWNAGRSTWVELHRADTSP